MGISQDVGFWVVLFGFQVWFRCELLLQFIFFGLQLLDRTFLRTWFLGYCSFYVVFFSRVAGFGLAWGSFYSLGVEGFFGQCEGTGLFRGSFFRSGEEVGVVLILVGGFFGRENRWRVFQFWVVSFFFCLRRFFSSCFFSFRRYFFFRLEGVGLGVLIVFCCFLVKRMLVVEMFLEWRRVSLVFQEIWIV